MPLIMPQDCWHFKTPLEARCKRVHSKPRMQWTSSGTHPVQQCTALSSTTPPKDKHRVWRSVVQGSIVKGWGFQDSLLHAEGGQRLCTAAGAGWG